MAANDQGRALELKRDKHLDATWTLKNSEADFLKAMEDLKEMTISYFKIIIKYKELLYTPLKIKNKNKNKILLVIIDNI